MKKTLLFLALLASAEMSYAANCQNSAALFTAAYAGNRSVIEDYAKSRCSLTVKDKEGFSLYDIAGLKGDSKLQQWLVTQHAAKQGGYSPAMIKLIQTGLRYLNTDAGPITGKMNNTTTAAIKKYQKSLAQQANGKISATWLPHFNQAIIKQVQRDLGSLGYKVGKPDGVMGGSTRNAVQSFRTKKKLGNYNQIDDQFIYQLMMAQNDLQKKMIAQRDAKASQAAQKAQSQAKAKAQAAIKARAEAQQAAAQAKVRAEQERRLQAERDAQATRIVQQQAKIQQRVQAPVVVQPSPPTPIAVANTAVTTVVAEPSLSTNPQSSNTVVQTTKINIAEQARQAEAARQAQLAQQQAKQAEAARQAQLVQQQAQAAQQEAAARAKAARDQAELQAKMDALVAQRKAVEIEKIQTTPQTQAFNQNIAPVSIARQANNSSAVGGVSVNKKFNKLSGVLVFTGGAENCRLGGQTIDASWCRTYYPSGVNKQCDAVVSKTGVVVSLRCK